MVGTHLVDTIGQYLSVVVGLTKIANACLAVFVPIKAAPSNNSPRQVHLRDAQLIREAVQPQDDKINQPNHEGLG